MTAKEITETLDAEHKLRDLAEAVLLWWVEHEEDKYDNGAWVYPNTPEFVKLAQRIKQE